MTGNEKVCLCRVMMCIQDNVIQSCNRIISGSGKIKVVIRIVPQCTLVYITHIMPMYIRYVAIVMLGIFHEELSVLIRQNFFCLLFAVCNFILSVQLNFVVESVLYSGAYLSDCYQFYLT